jgi:hypothetical protein
MKGVVKDSFDIEGALTLEYGGAGTVVIVELSPGDAAPSTGDPVLLQRADGWLYSGSAEDVRVEAAAGAIGLFLPGLRREQVPVGSTLRWGSDIQALRNAVA